MKNIHVRIEILFILISLSSICTFHFKMPWKLKQNSFPSEFRLMGTKASETDLKIEAAVYEDDLYKVLGVSRNSSKAVLKQAYMKIVFNSHPDRNKTEEALSIFRNATYAYQILGKDDKARAAYDRKLDAQAYMNVLEDMGNDFIMPLAMDVAVPILNFTFQSVRSVAFPFLKDVFEQSSAVVMASMTADNSDTFDEIFSRASLAREKTANNQKLRNLDKTFKKLDVNLNQSLTKFQAAQLEEKESRKKTTEINLNISLETNANKELERLKTEFDMLYTNATFTEKELERKVNEETDILSTLYTDSEKTNNELNFYDNEVVRLESLLQDAKLQVQKRKETKSTLEATIKLKKEKSLAFEREYSYAVFVRSERETELKIATEKWIESTKRLQTQEKESSTWSWRLERDKEHVETLAQKIESLKIKSREISQEIEKFKKKQSKLEGKEVIRKGNILNE